MYSWPSGLTDSMTLHRISYLGFWMTENTESHGWPQENPKWKDSIFSNIHYVVVCISCLTAKPCWHLHLHLNINAENEEMSNWKKVGLNAKWSQEYLFPDDNQDNEWDDDNDQEHQHSSSYSQLRVRACSWGNPVVTHVRYRTHCQHGSVQWNMLCATLGYVPFIGLKKAV